MRFDVRLAMAFLLGMNLMAQSTVPANRRNFVSCPILRDTKTAPCWLAEYKGETYFLGSQGGVTDDFHPPQLDHEVLVEGTVASGPRVCGGIPLSPVKVSVLGEIAAACNTMRPAEDGIEAPAPQPKAAPISWVQTEGRTGVTLYYEFGDDFLSVPGTNAINALVNYFKSSGASRIEAASFRGATLLSDGTLLTEPATLPRDRAAKILVILKGLGVPERAVSIRTEDSVPKTDGVHDQKSRRTVLTVRP